MNSEEDSIRCTAHFAVRKAELLTATKKTTGMK